MKNKYDSYDLHFNIWASELDATLKDIAYLANLPRKKGHERSIAVFNDGMNRTRSGNKYELFEGINLLGFTNKKGETMSHRKFKIEENKLVKLTEKP